MPHEQPFQHPPEAAGTPIPGRLPEAGEVPPQIPDTTVTPEQLIENILNNPGYMKIFWSNAHRLTYGLVHDSDDLTQEVFARLMQQENFDPGKPLRWLLSTARNRAIDWHREADRRPQTTPLSNEEDKDSLPLNPSRDPSNDVVSRMVVRQILERLDAKYRAPLSLYYLRDMSVEEIASELGIEPGTVKSRLFYARKHARHVARNLGMMGSSG